MAKAHNIHAVKSARVYTLPEAAKASGVSVGTLRNWVRAGLPILKAEKPYLVSGQVLKDWVKNRDRKARRKLLLHEMLCMRCKAASVPAGSMVDCIPQTSRTMRLTALCPHCGGAMHRMISTRQLPEFARLFDVAQRE